MITEQQLHLLTLMEHDDYDVHIYLSYRRIYYLTVTYHMLDIEKLNIVINWFEENNKK